MLHEDAVKVLAPDLQIDDHLRRRVPGRLLEEVVELCLESGQSAKDILGHVVDSLYAQCRKGDIYPTSLEFLPMRTTVVGELADVQLLVQYTAFIHQIDPIEIEEKMAIKVDYLIGRSLRGEAVVYDGLLYAVRQRTS